MVYEAIPLDFLHMAFSLLPATQFLTNILDRYCSKLMVYKKHYQVVRCAITHINITVQATVLMAEGILTPKVISVYVEAGLSLFYVSLRTPSLVHLNPYVCAALVSVSSNIHVYKRPSLQRPVYHRLHCYRYLYARLQRGLRQR